MRAATTRVICCATRAEPDMYDRAVLFVLIVSLFWWQLFTAEPPKPDPSSSVSAPDPVGASMRARNEKYALCTGTVAQRRACWLKIPLAQ